MKRLLLTICLGLGLGFSGATLVPDVAYGQKKKRKQSSAKKRGTNQSDKKSSKVTLSDKFSGHQLIFDPEKPKSPPLLYIDYKFPNALGKVPVLLDEDRSAALIEYKKAIEARKSAEAKAQTLREQKVEAPEAQKDDSDDQDDGADFDDEEFDSGGE